jgi:hypothetical protein
MKGAKWAAKDPAHCEIIENYAGSVNERCKNRRTRLRHLPSTLKRLVRFFSVISVM